MRNSQKDDISDSSDNSDDNLDLSEENGRHLDKSKNPDLSTLVPASDSDSGSKCSVNDSISVNKNTKSGLDSQEPPRTTNTKLKEKDTGQGILTSEKSTFNFEDLTSDDEMYTLQCPEMYKKQNLLDKHIDFTKPKDRITTDTEKLQFELINSEKKFITLAVPRKSGGGSIVKLPLKGHIIIQKVVGTAVHDPFIEDMQEDAKVVFPQDLKIRHPLLGVDWEAHIQRAKKAIKKRNHMKNKRVKKEKDWEINGELKELKREGWEINGELKELKRESCEFESPVHKKKKKKLG